MDLASPAVSGTSVYANGLTSKYDKHWIKEDSDEKSQTYIW